MEAENQILSPQQSLDIITRMISQAQGNVRRSSIYLILWGVVVATANVAMYILIIMEYPRPYYVWLLTVPAWIATIYLSYKQRKESRMLSHLDRINVYLWFSYGIVVFTIVVFGFKINYQLNAVILVVTAIPAFISGTIIKFRPLSVGGIFLWIFGIICFLVDGPWQYLIAAVAVTTGYLVPGFMLRNKKDD